MSSGPGKLQNEILAYLPEDGEVLFRKAVWEIALSRGEITRTGNKWGDIEEGSLKRSFLENTRRACESLAEGVGRKIEKSERKIGSIEEMLDNYEYFTSRLEVFLLRRALRQLIKSYVEEDIYQIHRSLDYEEFQVRSLKTEKKPELRRFVKEWRDLEDYILKHLYANYQHTDILLNVLCRGRFLFLSRKENPGFSLSYLQIKIHQIETKNLDIIRIEKKLRSLVEKISNMTEYKVGEIKDIIYQFANVGTKFSSSTSLDDDLKKFLYKRNPDIVKALPGHKDREKKGNIWMAMDTQYSQLLDCLFDKYLFRAQIFLQKSN